MVNFTIITEFLLINFASIWELQVLYAMFFILIYLSTLMGNFLTIIAIITDQHLHAPMYFFLSNLSLLDMCYISVTLPKFIVNTLVDTPSISLLGCMAQMFLILFFGGTEFALLMTMSYDRFVAICYPLHYGVIMTRARCFWAAVGSWFTGFVYSALHTGNMFRLPFSGSNVIHQFFCDIPQILRVANSDVYNTEYLLLTISSCFLLLCFVFLIISYAHIFSSVLKIPSMEGRYKALSTCSPHLIVLLLFLLSIIISVLGPTSDRSSVQNLLIAMAYTVLPPFMNPIIYSLRNQKIKVVLIKIIRMALFLKKDVSSPKKIKRTRNA